MLEIKQISKMLCVMEVSSLPGKQQLVQCGKIAQVVPDISKRSIPVVGHTIKQNEIPTLTTVPTRTTMRETKLLDAVTIPLYQV